MNTVKNVQEHTLTYSEVMDYIIQGRSIPGIKDIPDTVLGLEAGSQAVRPQRQKPWETAQGSEQVETGETQQPEQE